MVQNKTEMMGKQGDIKKRAGQVRKQIDVEHDVKGTLREY